MITVETDRLVDDYLRRLEAAAAHLQRSRRAELIAEIREHIENALRQEADASEVAVRNVLERLGPPEEIVEAAEPPVPAAPSHGRSGALEITALLALLVPFIGWLVGIVLVFVSEAWSRRDKLIGLTILLVAVLLPLFGVIAQSGGTDEVPVVPQPDDGLPDAGTDSGAGVLEALGLTMLIGLPSALYLGWRLPPHPSELPT